MMRVLVVFCEGPHDVHFARRCLERHRGHAVHKGSANDLPTPFGWRAEDKLDPQVGLVVSQARRIDPIALDLEGLNFGRKPLFEVATRVTDSSVWALFVNMGGDSTAKEVIDLIGSIRAAMMKRKLDTAEVAFAFLFDADFQSDGRGLAWRVAKFAESYGTVFNGLDALKVGQWLRTPHGAVGLWVHCDQDMGEGTFEDHAARIFEGTPEWTTPIKGALSFVDGHAEEGAHVRAKRDKRWKAAITIAGQTRTRFDKASSLAGSGLNVMIQSGLSDKAFDDQICADLAAFLTDTPWNVT